MFVRFEKVNNAPRFAIVTRESIDSTGGLLCVRSPFSPFTLVELSSLRATIFVQRLLDHRYIYIYIAWIRLTVAIKPTTILQQSLEGDPP